MIFSRNFIHPFFTNVNTFAFAVKAQAKKEKTLYQVLQVPASAPQSNIRKNYIKLAKIYHPDVYKGSDKDRFQKIQSAYQILSNQKKRQEYDQQIGIRSTEPKNQDYQFGDKSDKKKQKDNDKKNDFTYQQTVKEKEQLNIDEQYQKFFGKKKQTDFQEIRLHEQIQFKQKSEDQRIRSRFTQYYENLGAQLKTKRQMPYQQMLDDQIKQRNIHHSDILQKIEQNIKRNSPQGIKRQKIIVYLISILLAIIVYPLFLSFWTKHRQQQEQKERIIKMVQQIQRKKQQAEIRSRFQY